MDGAMNGLANDAFQGDAPGGLLIGALHCQPEVVAFVGQLDGNSIIFCITCLSPVKRSAKTGAAGAAFKAGVGMLHKIFIAGWMVNG